MNIHVETERFLLRDIEETDVQDIFDLDEICGATDANHQVSNHILQKIGLTFDEKFLFRGIPVNFHRINKTEWLNRKITSW